MESNLPTRRPLSDPVAAAPMPREPARHQPRTSVSAAYDDSRSTWSKLVLPQLPHALVVMKLAADRCWRGDLRRKGHVASSWPITSNSGRIAPSRGAPNLWNSSNG